MSVARSLATVTRTTATSLPKIQSFRSCRAFSTTSRRCNGPSSSGSGGAPGSSSTKDPSHPFLWYHPLENTLPPRIALSFLPTVPRYGSSTVLGYLPLHPESGLNDFKEEPRFMEIVHATIRSGLEQGKAQTVEYEAATRPSDGFITLTDERAVPPAGRIGETEDLIGSVFVENGKLVPSTYEPFPSYRLVTSNGPLVLPRGLDEYLIERLQSIAEEEAKTAVIQE